MGLVVGDNDCGLVKGGPERVLHRESDSWNAHDYESGQPADEAVIALGSLLALAEKEMEECVGIDEQEHYQGECADGIKRPCQPAESDRDVPLDAFPEGQPVEYDRRQVICHGDHHEHAYHRYDSQRAHRRVLCQHQRANAYEHDERRIEYAVFICREPFFAVGIFINHGLRHEYGVVIALPENEGS